MTDTSKDAFKSIQGGRELMWLRILKQLAVSSATCDELEVRCALSHQTASARCSELRKHGMIARTGTVRRTRSGRNAHVYDITASGRVWVQSNEDSK